MNATGQATSSNFAFLAKRYPQLERIGALGERYFSDDPVISANIIRLLPDEERALLECYVAGSQHPACFQQFDEHLVIATPWKDNEEKLATVWALRRLFREKRVQRYAFMCEAWSCMAPNLANVVGWIGRLQDHPDRREILTVTAEDRDGANLMGWYFILRPEHGPAKLSPLHMSEARETAGQLMGLLR